MGLFSSFFGSKKPVNDKKTIIQDLILKANNGDVASMLELGKEYSNGATAMGITLQQSREEGAKWYAKAAAHGSAEAMLRLGNLYDPRLVLIVRKDAPLALSWYEKACHAGEMKATYYAGNLLSDVKHGLKDYARALRYYSMGADAGVPGSTLELAKMYDFGRGISRDFRKALMYYRKASAMGLHSAEFHMGDIHYFGKGVPVNKTLAAEHYRYAAQRDICDAKAMLDYMMLVSEIPLTAQDTEVFRHLLRLSEGFSMDRANFILGKFFEEGLCVDQDSAKAIQYYEKSAGTGNTSAMAKLAVLEAMDFPGHPANPEKARHWLKKRKEYLQ